MNKEKNEKKISKQISNKLRENRKKALKDKNSTQEISSFKKRPEEEHKTNSLFKSRKSSISQKTDELAEELDKTDEKASLSLSERQHRDLADKLKQALNDNLYLRAEFENFKKHSYEEKSRLILYGGESFIASLADEVLDDLDRAMFSVQRGDSFENLKKGLEIIQKKLSQILDRFGVKVIDPTGKAFDPSYQEALSYIKTSKVPEGYVAETFKKAYKLHDKFIRTAQVVLAKKEKNS